MKPRRAGILLAFCLATAVRTESQAPSKSEKLCVVQVSGIQFSCPAGWNIVDKNKVRGVQIGDFIRTDWESGLKIEPGHAAIGLHPKPDLNRDFNEWISGVARDPNNIRSAKTLPNKIVGKIQITVFSQDSRIPSNPKFDRIFVAYFFEFKGTPLCLELDYERSSKKASEYLATLDSILASLEPAPAKSAQ